MFRFFKAVDPHKLALPGFAAVGLAVPAAVEVMHERSLRKKEEAYQSQGFETKRVLSEQKVFTASGLTVNLPYVSDVEVVSNDTMPKP